MGKLWFEILVLLIVIRKNLCMDQPDDDPRTPPNEPVNNIPQVPNVSDDDNNDNSDSDNQGVEFAQPVPTTREEFLNFLRPNLNESKDQALKCLRVAHEQLDKLSIIRNQIAYEHELAVTRSLLNYCQRVYLFAIVHGINRLGFVGQAIKIWMRAINQFLLFKGADGLDLIGSTNDVKSLEPLSDMLRSTFEGSSSSDQNIILNNTKRLYMERAFIAGEGICFHVTTMPFDELGSTIELIWRKTKQLLSSNRFSSNEQSFEFTEQFTKPSQSRHSYSMISLFLALRLICNDLRKNPSPQVIVNTGMLSKAEQENIDLDGLCTHVERNIDWLIRQRGLEECTWDQLLRLKETISCVYEITGPSTSMTSHIVLSASRKMFERCLQPIIVTMIRDNSYYSTQTNNDLMITELFIEDLARFVEKTPLSPNQSILEFLNSRKLTDNDDLDELFCSPREPGPEVGLKTTLAYMNGSGICTFYNSLKPYDEVDGLFKLIEFFNQMASIKGFKFPVYTAQTKFYYMWKHCQSAFLIRFHTTYPPNVNLENEFFET